MPLISGAWSRPQPALKPALALAFWPGGRLTEPVPPALSEAVSEAGRAHLAAK